MTDFMGTCIDDLWAILLIIFSLWSLLWGISLIVRSLRRLLRTRRAQHWYSMDIEKGLERFRDVDKGISASPIRPNTLRKPRPADPSRSKANTQQPRASHTTVEEYLTVKSRLALFRFPAPSSPATSLPGLPDPILQGAVMASSPSLADLLKADDASPDGATGFGWNDGRGEEMTVGREGREGRCQFPAALPDSPTIPPTLFAISAVEAGFM
ncbi:hypothetical protein EIP91_005793 [Steccherinum ochraceum]|uniref:Uncharacterized protein n=1 Tax=Steccherinum ochraceum TaxID=92696 RepID=A0A4R0R6T8_9APHY|nr:hypothetical protein EIP91_005793 [Steccherinum ochraceum]